MDFIIWPMPFSPQILHNLAIEGHHKTTTPDKQTPIQSTADLSAADTDTHRHPSRTQSSLQEDYSLGVAENASLNLNLSNLSTRQQGNPLTNQLAISKTSWRITAACGGKIPRRVLLFAYCLWVSATSCRSSKHPTDQ